MKLAALLEFDTGLAFNEKLNPALWDEAQQLLPRVSSALKRIAVAFIEALDVEPSMIHDIILTGSNANYNWSKFSDIDLHFALDYEALGCPGEGCTLSVESCLQAKKSLWNLQHDMTVYGFPVEVYAHDSTQNLVGGAAAYSLVTDTWLAQPSSSLRGLSVPQEQVTIKAEALASEIDQALEVMANEESLKEIADKLWRMRQAGLAASGEASVENLTFKALRNNGYVDKLRAAVRKAEDDDLSLREHKLFELLDSKPEYDVVRADKYKFITKQVINGREIIFVGDLSSDGDEADIEFKEISDKSSKGTYALTGSGAEVQVFAMVCNSIKELVDRYSPSIIFFTAQKEGKDATKAGKDGMKRANVYEKLLKKFIPGYEITRRESGESILFRLYKN